MGKKTFHMKPTPGSKMVAPGAQGNNEGRSSPPWFRGKQVSMSVRGMRTRRMHMTGQGGKGVFEAQ